MALAIPDEVPLWSYGFRYTVPKAFEIARRCKAEGGRIWLPLEDNLDIERDPDPSLAAKEMEDTRVSEEVSCRRRLRVSHAVPTEQDRRRRHLEMHCIGAHRFDGYGGAWQLRVSHH